MASQNRCAVCDCRTNGQTLCYVHEPYRGAAQQHIDRARDATQLERARYWRAAALEASETRDGRADWAGGDGGDWVVRRLLLRITAGMSCESFQAFFNAIPEREQGLALEAWEVGIVERARAKAARMQLIRQAKAGAL